MNGLAPGVGKDVLILLARILLVLLFLIFGWNKLTDYPGAVAYMQMTGAPAPHLSAIIAVVMELGVGIAILVGIFTGPFALLLALYSIATAYIGHHYWTMTGVERFEAEINFYKNVSIAGGLLLLFVEGPGRLSIDALVRRG
jgi:putative oxidoreductase